MQMDGQLKRWMNECLDGWIDVYMDVIRNRLMEPYKYGKQLLWFTVGIN